MEADIFTGLSELTSLRLNGNQLTALDAGVFSHLSGLTRLYLDGNQLTFLEIGVFSGLAALRTLDLADNQLDTLKVGVFSGLSALTRLDLPDNELTRLEPNVFSDQTSLTRLYLMRNQLTSLEDSVFVGLKSLETLALQDNAVAPLPITISLELVEEGQFKAKAHTGAPFDIVLPIRIANGTLVDGEDSITIPTGSVASDIRTVSRTPGMTGAVTVDIGELPDPPGLPTNLSGGYALVKSADLPLEVISQQVLSFSEGSSTTRDFAENTAEGEAIGASVSATDSDRGSLTYSLEGTDAESFTIAPTSGQLQTKTGITYDYETKAEYSVIVRVADGQGDSATIDVTISLTDENERPVFSSAETFMVEENEQSVSTVVAVDVDREDSITGYAITGGADQDKFSIVPETGVLTFQTALNFEAPADGDNNNTYIVEVTATGGGDVRGLSAEQIITITVTDVDTEAPEQPAVPTVANATLNSLKVSWVAPTNKGPEISSYDVRYILSSASEADKADDSKWTEKVDAWTSGGGALEYTIGGLDHSTSYDVQVRASNDEGTGVWSASGSGDDRCQRRTAFHQQRDVRCA